LCRTRPLSFEHIIKGDATDGIPNILSADDTFAVDGKRQKPLAAKEARTNGRLLVMSHKNIKQILIGIKCW
jgi:hypothetical protein